MPSNKVSNVLSRSRPRKPIVRISPSTIAAELKTEKLRAQAAELSKNSEIVPEPEVETVPEPEVEIVPEPPLHLLGLSISGLTKALEGGEHDAFLAELLAAEESGKNRAGAKGAILNRMG
jgi:hypothetical protein